MPTRTARHSTTSDLRQADLGHARTAAKGTELGAACISGKVRKLGLKVCYCVFGDAIQGWILNYAARLAQLNEPAAGMAIIGLVAAYPETIECYLSGKDSKNASRLFFTNGMKRVFPEVANVAADALNSICDDLRDGLYHGR